MTAYWTGRHRESVDACRTLLDGGHLPADQRPRVIANLNFGLRALGLPESDCLNMWSCRINKHRPNG